MGRRPSGYLDRPCNTRYLREWQHTWKPPPVAQIAEANVIREGGLDYTRQGYHKIMRLRTLAMYCNRFPHSVPLEQTADVYLGVKQRRRLRIADGAHEMPIGGEIVIEASDPG